MFTVIWITLVIIIFYIADWMGCKMYKPDGTMKCNIYDNDGNLILSAPASVADCNIGVFTVEQDAVNESSLPVTGYCPECDTEVTMQWDVKTLGYKGFCPRCGKRLML